MLGAEGLTGRLSAPSRFHSPAHPAAAFGIFAHIAAGAAITLRAPSQLVAPLRRRAPGPHRLAGRLIAAAALVAALGGLVFILAQGTIGGAPMALAFGICGGAMAASAVFAVRHARARDLRRRHE